MNNLEFLFKENPYSLKKKDKEKIFNKIFNKLDLHHIKQCETYRKFIKITKKKYDMPVPIRVFKNYDLLSVNKNKIIQVMNSSGTSDKLSIIYLDKKTSNLQIKALVNISSSYLGKKRRPMIVLDKESILKSKNLSARATGILGFRIMANDICFALDENMKINYRRLKHFINKHKSNFIFFGFTFIIWKYFINELIKDRINLNTKNSVLIHGGGWKKMEDLKVSNHLFKKTINQCTKILNIHNYYGMIEQTGSIFFECNKGYFHCSNYSDIITRRNDFSECQFNEKGIIQIKSLLPYSYPGHNLLTEDTGIIYGQDNCKCNQKGKYFKLTGRIKKAELRGCSDIYD